MELKDIPLIGDKVIKNLNALSIYNVDDLTRFYPYRFDVLTRRNIQLDDRILVFHSMEDILKYIEDYKDEVMIIGGASIYRQFLDYSEKLVLTEIEAEHEADAFFPHFNKNEWDLSGIRTELNKNKIVFTDYVIYIDNKMYIDENSKKELFSYMCKNSNSKNKVKYDFNKKFSLKVFEYEIEKINL